jgi:hypothetical protein
MMIEVEAKVDMANGKATDAARQTSDRMALKDLGAIASGSTETSRRGRMHRTRRLNYPSGSTRAATGGATIRQPISWRVCCSRCLAVSQQGVFIFFFFFFFFFPFLLPPLLLGLVCRSTLGGWSMLSSFSSLFSFFVFFSSPLALPLEESRRAITTQAWMNMSI